MVLVIIGGVLGMLMGLGPDLNAKSVFKGLAMGAVFAFIVAALVGTFVNWPLLQAERVDLLAYQNNGANGYAYQVDVGRGRTQWNSVSAGQAAEMKIGSGYEMVIYEEMVPDGYSAFLIDLVPDRRYEFLVPAE